VITTEIYNLRRGGPMCRPTRSATRKAWVRKLFAKDVRPSRPHSMRRMGNDGATATGSVGNGARFAPLAYPASSGSTFWVGGGVVSC